MKYSVAPPCRNVTASKYCMAFAERPDDAPAFAHAGDGGVTCYALGHLCDVATRPILDGDGGVRITYGSGDSASVGAPRHLVYDMLCDQSAAPDAPPDTLVAPSGGTYEVPRRTPPACPLPAAPSRSTPAAAPAPDAAMLAFVEKEVGALICYNMATMDGTQGCPPFHVPGTDVWEEQVPQTAAGLDAATEQWAASIAAFGGRHAILFILPA